VLPPNTLAPTTSRDTTPLPKNLVAVARGDSYARDGSRIAATIPDPDEIGGSTCHISGFRFVGGPEGLRSLVRVGPFLRHSAALSSATAHTAKMCDLDIAPKSRTTTILVTCGCTVLATDVAEWMPLSPTNRASFRVRLARHPTTRQHDRLPLFSARLAFTGGRNSPDGAAPKRIIYDWAVRWRLSCTWRSTLHGETHK
jgi:hypothetical protein